MPRVLRRRTSLPLFDPVAFQLAECDAMLARLAARRRSRPEPDVACNAQAEVAPLFDRATILLAECDEVLARLEASIREDDSI